MNFSIKKRQRDGSRVFHITGLESNDMNFVFYNFRKFISAETKEK